MKKILDIAFIFFLTLISVISLVFFLLKGFFVYPLITFLIVGSLLVVKLDGVLNE